MKGDLTEYYAGKRLYGDDFGPDELSEWYEDEREGYANLGAKDSKTYAYEYHGLNREHSFRHIPPTRLFRNALGLGSAYGEEFQPILSQVSKLTIVDPSDAFDNSMLGRLPITRVKPQTSGDLPFESGAFDLTVCFSVLHHIANVSHVVRELHRCTEAGGLVFIREPITTMGDWRKSRPGLTKRERGIPRALFRSIVEGAGFEVLNESVCVFPPLTRLCQKLRVSSFNTPVITRLDSICSRAFAWNSKYYRPSIAARFAPAAVSFVLTK